MNMRTRILALATLLPTLSLSALAAAGDAKKGKQVFEQTCASCHGMKGMGDGPAGAALTPKARNFAKEKFKFGSTVAALTRTIENG